MSSESTIAYRRTIFPFQLKPYIIAMAISAGLCILLPVVGLVLWGVLSLLGLLCYILSFSLGAIIAIVSGFLFLRSGNSAAIFWCIVGGIFITFLTYTYFQECSASLFSDATISLETILNFYVSIGMMFWSWIPITMMIILGMFSFVTLCIMKIIDWRPHGKRIRYICPHENCGQYADGIVYACPHCGHLLENLYPSRFGIFSTACPNCHRTVGTSWLTGRNRYSKTCPECHNVLNFSGFGNIPESVFVIEGAAQSGKTSFMFQAINQWEKLFPLEVHYTIPGQAHEIDSVINLINKGLYHSLTPRKKNPKAYVLNYEKSWRKNLMYFFDTGGTTTDSMDILDIGTDFNLANGIFLVIDPWVEKGILKKMKLRKEDLPSTYQYGNQDANTVIGRLCTKLEHLYSSSVQRGFDIPICVVVTKCDMFNLKHLIAPDGMNYTSSSTAWRKRSKNVEKFLVDCGMYNFVNTINTRFRKIAFFAVSSAKDLSPDSNSSINPLLWVVKNAKY